MTPGRAAGAGRAPAVLVGVMVLLAVTASARPQPLPQEAVRSGERPLRVLAAQATTIALGEVARTESYDEDRLRVHRLHVARVLRGRIDASEAGIVELRTGSSRPALLAEGERVIVLLRPAPRLTYLARHLPEGDYLEVVGERDGVLPVGGGAEAEAVERVLAEGNAIASDDVAAARRLAFVELASPNPRLAADAVAELRRIGRLVPLARAEVEALGRALRDRRLEPAVRVALLQFIARDEAREAAPALATAEAETPAVLEALLAARAAVGAVSNPSQLAAQLDAEDPAVRAAAVRALGRLEDPAAVAELGRYATTDPDLAVRAAAVEALGASKKPAAVPILARTFESSERKLMQTSARALLDIGGPDADNALVDLALKGGSPEARRFAAFVLLAAHGRDNSAVRRMETSNPPPEVRDLLEHGLHVSD